MPERGTLKMNKAKRLLNFKANYPIESGYLKYISWYKDFGKSTLNLFEVCIKLNLII